MKCLLDMDGVLADFIGGAMAVHKRPNPYKPGEQGPWNVNLLIGMSEKEFYNPLDRSPSFWANLEKTAEADMIVSAVVEMFGQSNIGICTKPNAGPYCIEGKADWIRRHWPWMLNRIAFGRDKAFWAAPDVVLVDDNDENCEAFREAGGSAILVPRPWNSYYARSGEVMIAILEGLEEL